MRRGVAVIAILAAASIVGACASVTCKDFCKHYYGDCKLNGYLGSTSEPDCETQCGNRADAGACRDFGTVLGCLNGLGCSQLDLSTPPKSYDNLGRYAVCDIRGQCSFFDGG
jgi:hypothetical protein